MPRVVKEESAGKTICYIQLVDWADRQAVARFFKRELAKKHISVTGDRIGPIDDPAYLQDLQHRLNRNANMLKPPVVGKTHRRGRNRRWRLK